MAANDPKPYLAYLDKEMTIMGLLSAFGVTAVVIALKTALDTSHAVAWNTDPLLTPAGTALMLASALMFYRQRSLLAF